MSTLLSADEVLARVKSLPPLPRVALELQQALRADDVPIDRIVQAVGTDQAITATTLKIANSSFYGVSRRVVTLRDAVQILGLNTLAGAVLAASAMTRFDRAACPGFDVDACWRHALATALCARLLAAPRGIDADTAYTAGLLHDVGRLALATLFPQAFAATLAHSTAHEVLPVDAEQGLLGIDHAAVGAMVAEHWRLAPAIVECIGGHHAVPPATQRELLDVVHLADNIVHALDLTHEPDDMVPQLAIETWQRLQPSAPELQQLFEHVEARLRGCTIG